MSTTEDRIGGELREGVERLPAGSHRVHHDEAERVNQLLTDFFAPVLPTQN
jgi:epoxide hydrolase 4